MEDECIGLFEFEYITIPPIAYSAIIITRECTYWRVYNNGKLSFDFCGLSNREK